MAATPSHRLTNPANGMISLPTTVVHVHASGGLQRPGQLPRIRINDMSTVNSPSDPTNDVRWRFMTASTTKMPCRFPDGPGKLLRSRICGGLLLLIVPATDDQSPTTGCSPSMPGGDYTARLKLHSQYHGGKW